MTDIKNSRVYLFDNWNERAIGRKLQPRERYVGRCKTSMKRAGIVCLRYGDMLI